MVNINIIKQLAENKTIEEVISNIIGRQYDQTEQDLAQDLYMSLLEKDPELIENLYFKGDLQYFITRMVIQNVNSKNSPYYYTYKIPQRIMVDISDINDEKAGQTTDY
jgi:hypothetical protein